MQILQDNYFTSYRGLKLTRNAEDVLIARFHTVAVHSFSPRKTIPSSSMLFTGSHYLPVSSCRLKVQRFTMCRISPAA
jgi:hypothetical protein